jgi:hypothetical protein
MKFISPHPYLDNLGIAYFQQSCITGSEDASIGQTIDPHHQTINDLQIFINSYQQEGYLVIVCMDGNQDNEHVFR